MAFNGLGSFLRLFNWGDDATNAIDILSSRMDSEFANYKGGLENCVIRDGQNAASANLPMATFRHTAVGAAALRDQYGRVAEIQDTGYVWGGVAGGTANALTIALTPAITALTAGQTVRFVTGGAANSGAATLAVNGLTATAIVKDGNVALAANDLPANSLIEVAHNGTNYRLNRPGVLLSGAALTDVVHTTGNESIAGVKTLTTVVPIVLSSVNPVFQGRNTTLGLPSGLWRIYLPSSDDNVYFQKNTAVAGDFSTINNVFFFGATEATFIVPVAVASAVVAGHAVTKAQLDAKVYGGQVTNAGTAAIPYGPSGWTVNRNSVGSVTITHNLGTTNYAIVATPNSAVYKAIWATLSTNTVTILTYDSANSLADTGFTFVVARN